MSPAERCPVCHHPVALLWVHSHLQCPTCKTVVQPCCSGERADAAAGPETGAVK